MLRTESDLNVREDVTFALVKMGPVAIPSLIQLLGDTDAAVRHHAAHTLGKIGHADATDALITVLDDDEETVVMKAVLALGQIGDANALPALVSLLDQECPTIFPTLMNTLQSFGKDALPYLFQVITHVDWQVRERVIDILGAIGDEAAIPTLITALPDDHWQVQFSAATALTSIGGQDATDALRNNQHELDSRVISFIVRQLGS